LADSDAHTVVDHGLSAYNGAEPALADVEPLMVFARSMDSATVIAGAVGRTWGKCCELQQLWVASDYRRCGIGATLFSRFATEARKRGCDLLYLETFSFQAPDFYRACGCVVVLEVSGYTHGIRRFTMHCDLRRQANADHGP
jgi:GNAT superfamily N-acetyltransferase